MIGQKTRARDLLRKHYGLGVGPPPSGSGNRDTAFDAKAYYEQLITTSSLPTLLKKENELLTEIRELDSERQSLVYNHHHELIAASDTIAAMKARAENLDADMDLLKAAFSEISRLSAEVVIESEHSEEEQQVCQDDFAAAFASGVAGVGGEGADVAVDGVGPNWNNSTPHRAPYATGFIVGATVRSIHLEK
ncbi:Vps51/Vps67-domain-containing protein [Irpex lacteus]|nr:Vps51/Vps67-domain-containing protein [Irpex lacteus]